MDRLNNILNENGEIIVHNLVTPQEPLNGRQNMNLGDNDVLIDEEFKHLVFERERFAHSFTINMKYY